MDWKEILQIIEIVALIFVGFVISYLRTSQVVYKFVTDLIDDAEELFFNIEKSGLTHKLPWVIEQIQAYIPAWLKPFLTAEKIQAIVQTVFDKVKAYADIQVSKLQAKYEAWSNAKTLEFAAEKENSAALRAALDKQAAEHDEALSAALIAKINAEATLARATPEPAPKKNKK